MKSKNKSTYEEKIKAMENDLQTKQNSYGEEVTALFKELEDLKSRRASIFRKIFRTTEKVSMDIFECATGAFKVIYLTCCYRWQVLERLYEDLPRLHPRRMSRRMGRRRRW